MARDMMVCDICGEIIRDKSKASSLSASPHLANGAARKAVDVCPACVEHAFVSRFTTARDLMRKMTLG